MAALAPANAPSTPAPVEVVAVKRYVLSHLSDDVLLRGLAATVARERSATAEVLAHIAEVDARKLYLPAAYPSMFAYCVGELRLSEDAAAKRIQAARVARRFLAIFDALADGRLHLAAVVLLAPHLTEDTAGELLAAAAGKSKAEVERLLAARFPRTDLLTWLEAVPASALPGCTDQHAPGHVDEQVPPGEGRVQHAPAHAGDRPKVAPLSAGSFALQLTMSSGTHDKLRYAQELLGHQVASGDLAEVLDRVLDLAIVQLEKQKFAATARPRRRGRLSADPRHIPADIRRAVWERDQGQCTFVSDSGHRCEARKPLEFDHIQEVARGGEASVTGLRLRCRAHNQYTAERTFGAEFMRHKRIAAADARAAAAREQATTRTQAARQKPASEDDDRDVVPWLRALGFSAAEARRAAERCEDMPDAPIEERVRVALSCFRVRGTRLIRPGAGAAAATPPA